jgi:hypothetical protein
MMISHDWWWLCLAAGASMTIGLILNGSLALD